jgi:serine phosphatase RsbU (regulator of sigma subunit)
LTRQKVLILMSLIFITLNTYSQRALRIVNTRESEVSLGDFIEIYCDSTNSLDKNQIKSERFINYFTPLTDFKEKISSKHTYWVHFAIENYDIIDTKFGLYIPAENHIVDIYTLSDSTINIQKTGFFINRDKNDEVIPLSNIIRIKGSGKVNFYIKIKNINDELPRFQLRLVNIEKATLKNKRKITIDAIVQGMIWLMLLYGIFLFILHKEKLYLYYSAYSLCLSLWLMGTWGFYYQFSFDLPRSLYTYQSIPGFLGILFYVQFIRAFITTSKIFPKWDKILKIIQLVTLIEIVRISVFVPVTNLVMTNYYIQATVSMFLEILLMIFIINVLLTKVQYKYIIGIGSSILIIFNFAGALLWIMYNDNTWFIFQKTGAVLELLIFNFGLSYRYMLIEKKEQKFQKKLIFQLRKNAELQEKVNRELELKVQERTVELKEKNEVLEHQKNEIEYHSNNLTTSIHYAQQIQSAVFPSDEILRENLPEHFILFKPLDIVSGDFYWFKQNNNFVYVVAADCTGHGVPGAFMSILGITFLNEIVNKNITFSTNELLNQFRDHVIKTLHQSHHKTTTRDGIEMALCIFDIEHEKLQFSGAFRPMYIIRDNQLLDIKGDNMPIGIYDEVQNSFTNKDILLKNDDIVYLFTDGYVDQIGGSERKTFKAKKFKELLLDIHRLPVNEQKQILERKIEEWKGDLEQTDDILVIGIKVT